MVNVGFTQFSPSMVSFFNINDIPTTLKIHWAMIKTCLYAAGVNLNRIWAQKMNFWALLLYGQRLCPMGSARLYGQRPCNFTLAVGAQWVAPDPMGSAQLLWVARGSTLSITQEITTSAFKNFISTFVLWILVNDHVCHIYI